MNRRNRQGRVVINLTEQEQLLNLGQEGRGSDSYPMISQSSAGGKIINQPTNMVTRAQVMQRYNIPYVVLLCYRVIYKILGFSCYGGGAWSYPLEESSLHFTWIQYWLTMKLDAEEQQLWSQIPQVHTRHIPTFGVYELCKNDRIATCPGLEFHHPKMEKVTPIKAFQGFELHYPKIYK